MPAESPSTSPSASPSDPTPDYCPFCGARLRDEGDAYGGHLHRHEDCRERAEAWASEERGPALPWTDGVEGRQSVVLGGITLLLAIAILGYAVLVLGNVLLGVVGTMVVALGALLVSLAT